MNNKNIVALLPMKAHSERVPDKNIKKIVGEPLYHHILESLCASKYIKNVYIDTDSDIIADEAPKIHKKIKIIVRPEKLRGDFVSMNKIIAYDLSQIDDKYFLQTHSTNPLLKTSTVDKAVEMFFENMDKHDSLFSVTKLQVRLHDEAGKPVNYVRGELLRTQDLPPLYEENSNLYIFSKNSFNKSKDRIGQNPYMFEMNKIEAIDIDTPEDFQLAELVKKGRII